ncbi:MULTISPECIES: antitoxin AF2212-like protein [unclassified Microcoleus]|uniref:antitoxin family protein n=1 Tax=unclassified Microcoleus TaxID=2642155 RepID=UPI0025F775A2|nr:MULTISPECIES: antitoxin AF2212-like protein [unclassified Microcoleus]
MPETITAVYENGVFRPLSSVSFQDGETVRIQLWPDDPKKQAELAIQFLVDRGLVIPLPNAPDKVEAVTDEDVYELAQRLAAKPGKPLSEIIIEDRGPW